MFPTIAGTGREAGGHGGDCPDGRDPVTGILLFEQYKKKRITLYSVLEFTCETIGIQLPGEKIGTYCYLAQEKDLGGDGNFKSSSVRLLIVMEINRSL